MLDHLGNLVVSSMALDEEDPVSITGNKLLGKPFILNWFYSECSGWCNSLVEDQEVDLMVYCV